MAPRPRSSPPPDGERDYRTGARGCQAPGRLVPRGVLARRQARLGPGLPRTAARPYLPRLGALPGKRSGHRWTGVPKIAARFWGWPGPTGLTTDRGGLPRPGTALGPSLAVPDARFPAPPSPEAGGFPGRLWPRGQDRAWTAPGEPAREHRLGPLPRHGTPDPARPGMPPTPPVWPDPDSAAAGCPSEPPMVPPAACKTPSASAGPCKPEADPPRTAPRPTSPGHQTRAGRFEGGPPAAPGAGARAGSGSPRRQRAVPRCGPGPGTTAVPAVPATGPVCWDVVLRVRCPRCCHLPCAPGSACGSNPRALSTTLPELPQE